MEAQVLLHFGAVGVHPYRESRGTQGSPDINDPSAEAYSEPVLTPEMIRRVNEVVKWGRDHPKMMFIGSLVTVPRLSEFVYDVESFRPPPRPIGDPLRVRPDPSGPAANTRASTPKKGKIEAPSAIQTKPKVIDKGKAKVIDTGKPKKVSYPIQTGGQFKIREPKPPTPPRLPIAAPLKKPPVEKAEKPAKVARVLKLQDEEESPEVGGHVETHFEPAPRTHDTVEDSVEVLEAPAAKKRKLSKAAELEVPTVQPAASATEEVDVAGFLASRRKKAELPSVPRLAEVEAFIANEPVPAVPVAVVNPVGEEPLRAPEGPIPSLLNKPLGSNIQHILDDIDMELEDSVGMADEIIGPSPLAAKRVP
jgi:hypothetical protein